MSRDVLLPLLIGAGIGDIVKCCGSADLERIHRVHTMKELSMLAPAEIPGAARSGT